MDNCSNPNPRSHISGIYRNLSKSLTLSIVYDWPVPESSVVKELRCVCVSWSVVSNSATLWILPGFSVHAILQVRILECTAIPFSRRSSWPRDQTQVSCILYHLVIFQFIDFFKIWWIFPHKNTYTCDNLPRRPWSLGLKKKKVIVDLLKLFIIKARTSAISLVFVLLLLLRSSLDFF